MKQHEGTPLISVIIPAYNCEKYISDALESVLSQPIISLMEIVVVNDGSVDSTLKVCMEYEKRYTNIYVLSQENQGVSVARNMGIKNAKGKYILFLDADDQIVNNVLDQNFQSELQQDYDLFAFSSLRANTGRKRYAIDLQYPDAISSGGRIHTVSGTFCACLYSRRLLELNDIKFDAGVRMNEDQVFKLKTFYFSRKIRMHSRFLYIYNKRLGSTNFTLNETDDRVIAWQKAYEWFSSHHDLNNLDMILQYIMTKIRSRMLLYAKCCAQKGYSKASVLNELDRLGGRNLLMSATDQQVMPYQKEELYNLQNDYKKFYLCAKREYWKIKIGRGLLRIATVRKIRDKRQYPITTIPVPQREYIPSNGD